MASKKKAKLGAPSKNPVKDAVAGKPAAAQPAKTGPQKTPGKRGK
mgnify:CR=1 FL=1